MDPATSFVVRNDVPLLERALAWFFVAVGIPLTYLVWRDVDQVPSWAIGLFGVLWPTLVVGLVVYTYRWRHRLIVRFGVDPPTVETEERTFFRRKRQLSRLVEVTIEEGEDSEGDPYARLLALFDDGRRVPINEGHDLDEIRLDHARVEAWLGAGRDDPR